MMDWVHCNRCYSQPCESDPRKFMITSCGHLFCTMCHTPGEMKECQICQREGSAILLEAGMTRDMEIYFLEPDKTIKKHTDVITFQQCHRNRFILHLRDTISMQKTEIATLKEENKRHRDEKNKLKDEINKKNDEIKRHREEKNQLKNQLSTKLKSKNPWPSRSHDSMRSQHSSINSPVGSAANVKHSASQSVMGSRIFGTQLQNIISPTQSQSGRINRQEFSFRINNNSSSPLTGQDSNLFTPPLTKAFQNAHRVCTSETSPTTQRKTPPAVVSPASSEYQHPNSQQRRLLLPGDRMSSPVNKIGLQRLSLQGLTPNLHRTSPPLAMKPGRNLGITPQKSRYINFF